MCVDEFRRFIRAERKAIDEFRTAESGEQRNLTRNEAARIWIEKYADDFRINYEKQARKNDGR